MIKKLPKGKQAKGLSKELINRLMPYKKHILSITSDNGTEFSDHQNIAENLGVCRTYQFNPLRISYSGMLAFRL